MHDGRVRSSRKAHGKTGEITQVAGAGRAIAAALAAANIALRPVRRVRSGESGDLVARVGPDERFFLKLARSTEGAARLRRETAALVWLAGKAPVAEIVWTGDTEAGPALVTLALPGAPVSEAGQAEAEPALAASMATLAALHALDPADCPFDCRLERRLEEAGARVAAGLVDESDFDADRRGWTARKVLDTARSCAPASEDLVVTHGDACLPNFIWARGDRAGMVDLGRFGLADRYQDLALILRSARRNHPGVDAERLLNSAYPLPSIDEAKCSYYRLLDELF